MPEPKFLYGSHYSTPGYVLFYLVRIGTRLIPGHPPLLSLGTVTVPVHYRCSTDAAAARVYAYVFCS